MSSINTPISEFEPFGTMEHESYEAVIAGFRRHTRTSLLLDAIANLADLRRAARTPERDEEIEQLNRFVASHIEAHPIMRAMKQAWIAGYVHSRTHTWSEPANSPYTLD